MEKPANQHYWMELEGALPQQVWAYRKAAWAVEDMEQDIRLVYRQMGRKGLERLPDVKPQVSTDI